jgi:hypothetical protein
MTIAEGIDLEGIGHSFYSFANDDPGFVLVSRGGTGLQEFLEECRGRRIAWRGGWFGFLRHDR